uniref:Tyrosine-protein phosphatase domain-containing protein n=1 Tax=Parastrongyloides trichosuri TaxID=131310 RepID=A0A0N4ZYT8_PARTI
MSKVSLPKKRKSRNSYDEPVTVDENEKKNNKKTKDITKKAGAGNPNSVYTNLNKSKSCNEACVAPTNSQSKKALNENNKINSQSAVPNVKKKAPSRDKFKPAPSVQSKNKKKDFCRNDDEEEIDEGNNKENPVGTVNANNKEEIIDIDMAKTCYIESNPDKDVRKKFCEYMLGVKHIKHITGNKAFKDIKYTPKNLPAVVCNRNYNLNRYNDVFCIDATRVKLNRNLPEFKNAKTFKNSYNNNLKEDRGVVDDDYIHANYVKIPNSDFTYICCQGPLENTLEDHWLMCWQEKVKVIVMLCETIEDDEEKCHKYWPDVMTKKAYGQIIVINEKEDLKKYDGVVIRTLKMQVGSIKKSIIQYHFKAWPDRLVPTATTTICSMLREIQLVSGQYPIVVHCSAGIGRTGTFMGIHYISERFKVSQDGSINIMEAIKEMREQRLKSVQTTIQYAYLHICLLQYFCEENVYEYSDTVKEYIKKNVDSLQFYAKKLAQKQKEQLKNDK